MDPGSLPQFVLDDPQYALTQMEEIIIAPVHALMSVVTVHGGQTKYAGHICNFARHNEEFNHKLPLLPEECDIVVVKRTTHDPVLDQQINQQYRVCRHVVQRHLEYFEVNHPTFISRKAVFDRTRLEDLPEDGSVHDRLRSLSVDEIDSGRFEEEGPPSGDDEDENNDHLFSNGFVPNVTTSASEQQQLRMALNGIPDGGILIMPSIDNAALNEWDHQRIAIQAFPSLFPTGKADLNEPRQTKISPIDWANHLMRYEDGCFARHPRFRYWILNTIMRGEAKKDIGWYMSKNPNERNMTVEEIQQIIDGNDQEALQKLAERVARSGTKLTGTKPFWIDYQRKLTAMIRQLKSPSAFVTASSADMQWPDMHQHMPSWEQDPDATQHAQYRKQRDDLNNNPAIAAAYFVMRWEIYVKMVLKKKFNITDSWWR